jgi:hypothetical protein
MRRTARTASLALALALAAPAALGQGEPRGGPMPAEAELPVTRVVLFTSGVAYFEHEGTVVGDQAFELSVPPSEMDDMLQSLVLQDLGGGTVEPVTYDSRDPLSRILAGYSIDLSGAPTLAEILAQLRGEVVHLEASRPVSGAIVSVERVEAPEEAPRTFVTLATASGLTRVDLAQVTSVRLEDPELQSELEEALAAVARYRAAEATTLRLEFSGEGERRVRVGYVREMPVWKSTYRLVVGDDGTATLQGWAIFDNPTDLDLEDVRVSFVAGQPAAFVTSLYDPVYAERARVEPPTAAAPTPRADEGVLGRAAVPPPAFAPQAEASEAADLAAGVAAMATGARSGATFAYHVDTPVSVGRHQSVMVPIVQTTVQAARLSHFDPRVHEGNPLAAVRLVNDTGLHLAAGTVTVYDANGFAGNALLADLVPGDSRVLAYAVDLEVAGEVEGGSEPERVVAARLVRGLLETETRQRVRQTVRLTPRTGDERLVLVDLPRLEGYEVVSPRPAPLLTPDALRFGVVLNATDGSAAPEGVPVQLRCPPTDEAEACELEVVLERVTRRTLSLADLAPDVIAVYLEDLDLDDETRAVLEDVMALQREAAQLRADVQARQDRVADITADQERVRANMQGLDRDSSLYRRYVADLEAQEDELDGLETELAELRQRLRDTERRLQDLISGLGG